MSETQARRMLRELVCLRGDIERHQAAMGAAATVGSTIRSSFADLCGRYAFEAHQKYLVLEAELVRLLSLVPAEREVGEQSLLGRTREFSAHETVS